MRGAIAREGQGSTIGLWAVALALAALLMMPLVAAWTEAPDLGHAWAWPVLAAYLWWERWAERPGVVARTALPRWLGLAGGAALIVALPMRLLLTPYPLWPLLVWSYVVVLVGIGLVGAWVVGGRPGVRWLGGPLCLLPAVLPWPTRVEQGLILPLRETLAGVAGEVINLAGYPALVAGTSIRVGHGWVGIDEACGGIRSLQACVMIALFFGEWYRFEWGRRLALLVAGVVAAVVGNFLRVLFLSFQSTAGGERAVAAVHDPAGWVALGGSLLLTGFMAWRWANYRWPQTSSRRTTSGGDRGRASLRGVAAVVAVLVIFEVGTRVWYGVAESRRLATGVQWVAQFPSAHWSFRALPLEDRAREMLRPDLFAGGEWQADRDVTVTAFYIEWRKGQAARSIPFLHNPTVCMPYAGFELVESLGRITVRLGEEQVPFFCYRFRRMREDVLVAFTIWDPSRHALLQQVSTESWTEWMGQKWADVRAGRKDQPAQLLSVAVAGSGDLEAVLKREMGSIMKD